MSCLGHSVSTLCPTGQLFLCEYGLAYVHPRHGAIVLPKPELSAIHVYDGVSNLCHVSLYPDKIANFGGILVVSPPRHQCQLISVYVSPNVLTLRAILLYLQQ